MYDEPIWLWRDARIELPENRSLKLVVIGETKTVKCAFFTGSWWICEQYQYAPQCISHWMDLPAPPVQ